MMHAASGCFQSDAEVRRGGEGRADGIGKGGECRLYSNDRVQHANRANMYVVHLKTYGIPILL